MIAALPMYDRPETAAALDALWAGMRDGLRARGIDAPDALDRETPIAAGWRDPELVLGQTCGLPYRLGLHQEVTLVATFDHALPDTPPGHYRSALVARADTPGELADFATRRFAYNQPESHSGWAAPQLAAAELGFRFAPALETGGHRASALAVAEGAADIAGLDGITWRMIQRWEPELAGALRVVANSPAAPALPLIAAKGADADATFAALEEAVGALDAEARDRLGIAGLLRIPAEAYLDVPTPPGP